MGGLSAMVYQTKHNPRQGLKYEILKVDADELGLDYTKKEYEKEYINLINNENRDEEEK